MNVSIYDASNKLVFSDRVRHTDGFTRPYNFSNLSEGDYTIAVEDGSGKTVEKINHRSNKQSKSFHVIRLTSQPGKYLITAAGKGKENVQINIFDEGKLVHSQSKRTNGDFAQLYNLTKAKGALTFEITGEDGTTKSMTY